MKFNHSKPFVTFFLGAAFLLVSQASFALKSDTSQPINVHSAQQDVDIQKNIVIFTGNVVVTQGSIKINADKVVITRPDGNQGKEVIEGYGNPATFYQMQDNGKPIRGNSLKMRYQVAEQQLILTGNAYVEQQNSHINANQITYLVQQQKMQATSEKGKPVTTTLVPGELQNSQKNNPADGKARSSQKK